MRSASAGLRLAQQRDERGRARADGGLASLAGALQRVEECAQAPGIAERFDHRCERAVVERRDVALQAVRDDAIPLGRVAARTLAQDLRVIDLADLEMIASACGPCPADAALGDEVFRRAAEQRQ
jgi:hypothetical protein